MDFNLLPLLKVTQDTSDFSDDTKVNLDNDPFNKSQEAHSSRMNHVYDRSLTMNKWVNPYSSSYSSKPGNEIASVVPQHTNFMIQPNTPNNSSIMNKSFYNQPNFTLDAYLNYSKLLQQIDETAAIAAKSQNITLDALSQKDKDEKSVNLLNKPINTHSTILSSSSNNQEPSQSIRSDNLYKLSQAHSPSPRLDRDVSSLKMEVTDEDQNIIHIKEEVSDSIDIWNTEANNSETNSDMNEADGEDGAIQMNTQNQAAFENEYNIGAVQSHPNLSLFKNGSREALPLYLSMSTAHGMQNTDDGFKNSPSNSTYSDILNISGFPSSYPNIANQLSVKSVSSNYSKDDCNISTDSPILSCAHCPKVFKDKRKLTSHMTTHTFLRPFECSECKMTFKTKSYLKKHMVAHSDERRFQCSECSKQCKRKCDLNHHMLTHGDSRPFQCDICQKQFKSKGYLNYHKLGHTGLRLFDCLVCNMSFRSKTDVKRHMITHQPERGYQCPECCKGFSKKSFLKSHMIRHSDETPFQCPICDARFKAESYLDKHIISRHSDAKPFQCQICYLNFKRKGDLKLHILNNHCNNVPGVREPAVLAESSTSALETEGDLSNDTSGMTTSEYFNSEMIEFKDNSFVQDCEIANMCEVVHAELPDDSVQSEVVPTDDVKLPLIEVYVNEG